MALDSYNSEMFEDQDQAGLSLWHGDEYLDEGLCNTFVSDILSSSEADAESDAAQTSAGLGDTSSCAQTPEEDAPHEQMSTDVTHHGWPWLREKGQDRPEVQQWVFDAWCAYRSCRSSATREVFHLAGVDLPIFQKPPGYESEFVKRLEEHARQCSLPTFDMKHAICVIDSRWGQLDPRKPGDRVTFGGPKGRSLHPKPFCEGMQEMYVARLGCDKVPAGSTVKAWRFDLVATKEDPAGEWYLCLFVPYSKPVTAQPKRRRVDDDSADMPSPSAPAQSPVGGEAAGCASVDAQISNLVDTLFQKARSRGFLTKGKEQERNFRQSVAKSLQTVVEPFQGQELRVKWPDYVFEDNYARLTFAEVCQHFEEHKHLPHLRPAKEVEATGVDVISDHVKLVECVENLYLYLRDQRLKSEEEMTKLQRLLEHQSLDSQVPSNIAKARVKLRRDCWSALLNDDPDALLSTIEQGALSFNVSASDLLVLLERWLWKLSAGKSGTKPVGLLAAAATNIAGVPEQGALKCLEALLRRFPEHGARASAAIEKAEQMGRKLAGALLRDAAKGDTVPAAALEPGAAHAGPHASLRASEKLVASQDAAGRSGHKGARSGRDDKRGEGKGDVTKPNRGGRGYGGEGEQGSQDQAQTLLVSSMLYKKEAQLFGEFAEIIRSVAGAKQLVREAEMLDEMLGSVLPDQLTKTLQMALQHQHITVSVKGSVEKGTNIEGSDIDVFIDTHGRSVSRREKEAVVELLRKTDGFHPSHVKLKKLAIGCIVMGKEVDLVFSDTEEYGQLPGNFAQRFQGNTSAQAAARVLKLCFGQPFNGRWKTVEKVPSFVLEILALEAQENRAKMLRSDTDVLGDGSIEIFCDALQLLVDRPQVLNSAQARLFALAVGESGGLRGTELKESKVMNAHHHARELLHLLCASRIYSPDQEGFVDLCDIERWIRGYGSSEIYHTPLGPVPGWVMGRVNNEEESLCPFIHTGGLHPGTCRTRRTQEECERIAELAQAAHVFLTTSLGRFAKGAPQIRAVASPVANEGFKSQTGITMRRLREYAEGGSGVAQYMLHAREFWCIAESELQKDNFQGAIRFFAMSARASQENGDPFSGWWRHSGEYRRAVDFVLQSTCSSEAHRLDAMLVLAWMCMSQTKWSEMEKILADGIKQSAAKTGSVDPAWYHMRFLSRGNVSNWRGVLEDTERCIRLRPEHPMPYYWKAVALRNLAGPTEDETATRENTMLVQRRDALRHFIKIAAPEGRKVCQAWWDLALCEMQLLSESGSSRSESFNAGDMITVAGLQAKPQHNGKTGKVIGCQNDRIQVRLQDGSMTEIALKPVNLVKKTDADPHLARINETIEKGLEAEEKMLPILREHEARDEDTAAKKICLSMRKAVQSKGKDFASSPFCTDMLNLGRKRGNDAFRSQDYEQAVHEYSSLIEIFDGRDLNDLNDNQLSMTEMHVLLSNRSASFEKLQKYDAAERDALEVIKLKPAWVKGYMRLIRARIGCLNAGGALQALDQARVNLAPSDVDTMRDLEAEVQSLLSKGVPKRCDPTLLRCWPSVRCKDSVIVVDANGSGDFVLLQEALDKVFSHDKPSTIIMLAGIYTLRRGLPDVRMQSFQIVGDRNVYVTVDNVGCVFSASGPDTSVFLDDLKVCCTRGHCIAVCEGASATVTRCEMESGQAACYSDGPGSSLLLLDCKACGPGAGPLATNHGFLEARNCHFSGSRVMSVEVRTFGSCLLKSCRMSNNVGQGICVWKEGVEAILQDCIVEKCGKVQSKGAVMVCCGKVSLLRCSIESNRGDGIVMQDENGKAHLDVNSCRIHANGGVGIAMHGGSGHLVDNRVQENAVGSVHIGPQWDRIVNGVRQPLNFREIHLVRNTFCSTTLFAGGELHPVVVISTISMKKMLKLVTFDNNTVTTGSMFCLFAVSDFDAGSLTDMKFKGQCCVDIATGLTMDESQSMERILKERDACRVRMQNQPTESQDYSYVHFNKKSLVDAHERAVDERSKLSKKEHIQYTTPGPPPTNKATGASLASLHECSIRDLIPHLGQRARGRVLYGTTCTRPNRLVSLMTILEDSRGEAVKIALYNVTSVNSERWRECFPKGMKIGLKEPFLKRFSDSSIGIRVDSPSDIVYVTPICMRLGCGVARTDSLELKVCSRCRVSKYCSPRCQKMDWNDGHKHSCKPSAAPPQMNPRSVPVEADCVQDSTFLQQEG